MMHKHPASLTASSQEIDPQWYALTVVPQKEYVVGHLLERQGIATFIPTEIRTHKRSSYSKGKAEFAVPVIPGVVFAGFPVAPAWYNLMQIDLIRGAIGMDGSPWRLDFVRLLKFFAGVNDGRMVFDEGLRLIHIPGRNPVRALTTRTRTISAKKRKAGAGDHLPVEKPSPRADFLSRFIYGGSK